MAVLTTTLFPTNASQVQAFAGALYGVQVGSATMAQVTADITAAGGLNNALNAYYTASFGTAKVADVGDTVAANLGLTGTAATSASAYIAAQLTGKTATGGAVIANILNLFASLTADATYGTAATAWNTKVASAASYTGAANLPVGTVVAATTPFTTNADNLIGSTGDDTFTGVAGTGATFGVTDAANGGAGVDTLSLVSDAAATTLLGSALTSIEKISINQIGAGYVAFSGMTGVTDLINNNSSADLEFGRDNADSGNDVNAIATLTVNGASANTKITYSDTALTGAADVQNVNLSSYGTATASRTLTILTETASTNELETLNLALTGTNGITLTTDGTQTSLKTIAVTGAGKGFITLANDNVITSATTIDASANTGGVIIGGDTGTTGDAGGQALGAANHKVTLGTGDDLISFGANLNSSDTVAGGTGTDTLAVTAALTNAIMTNVTGFEVIRFDAGAALTQDAGLSSMSGMSYQLVSAAQTYTLNNLANAASVSVLGGAATTTAVALALKDSTGLSDSLSVSVVNGASNAVTTVTAINDVTGLETLNLSSTGGTGTNVITTLSEDGKVVLTGSAPLTITNAIVTNTFDGSAFTGKLTAKTAAATNTNIATGTGADSITTGTGTDTVNTGAGNDLIINGTAVDDATGADVLFGGAGNDTFQLQGTGLAATLTNYSTLVNIKDFTVGTSTSATDFIKLSASGVYAQATALTAGTSAQGSITAADAVVVQSLAQNATAAVATGANVFKLTTGVAFTTDFQGTFNAAIGTGSITGLVAGGAVYAGLMYDTTNSKAVLFAVNDATATNTVIDTGDAIKVIGAIDMSAADYANLSAVNFAVFAT